MSAVRLAGEERDYAEKKTRRAPGERNQVRRKPVQNGMSDKETFIKTTEQRKKKLPQQKQERPERQVKQQMATKGRTGGN